MWVFLDLLSIPQRDRALQLKAIASLITLTPPSPLGLQVSPPPSPSPYPYPQAIASLPYYASLCSRFIPLVRDPHF